MNKILSKLAFLGIFIGIVSSAQASIINFDFTGRLAIVDPTGAIMSNMPISAALSYDTASGIGSSDLSITTDVLFFNQPLLFHNIAMSRIGETNIITGEVLVDWNVNNDMPMHVEWDATGLFNAIEYGLQAGDVLSGSVLYRDANGNGVRDAGEYLTDIGSANPHADSLSSNPDNWAGPAPMAATGNSLGLDSTTPFEGIKGYFDIGSGNSMHVTSVSSVPVPAAVWLFGSGLLGLIGIARRK